MPKQKIVYSLSTLYSLVADVKRNAKRIGLTHGAFDLFHYSHLDLLQKSSRVCDFLIVGVDSDESVANYKTYRRPIVDQEQRLKIISELNCVDAVFVKSIGLDRQSHIEMYRSLLVDVITIGERFDSRYKDVVKEEAQEVGAALIEIVTHQNPSTTSIINTVINRYSQ